MHMGRHRLLVFLYTFYFWPHSILRAVILKFYYSDLFFSQKASILYARIVFN